MTPQANESNAATLDLLTRHRQARELLKSQSAGHLWEEDANQVAGACGGAGTGLPPKMRRPQSASSVLGVRLSGSTSTASRRPRSAVYTNSTSHCSMPPATVVSAARAHFVAHPKSPNASQIMPQSTFQSLQTDVSISTTTSGGQAEGNPQELLKAVPSSASSSGPTGTWYCPLAQALLRPNALPTHQQGDKPTTTGTLPVQGQSLISSISSNTRGPPVLPPLPRQSSVLETTGATGVFDPAGLATSIATACQSQGSRPGQDPLEDSCEFSEEELRLEAEIEEALTQLEAVDAAVGALKLQLELANEDIESTSSELSQLKNAAASWEQAQEDGRRELRDREQRLEELLKVLPVVAEPEPLSAQKQEEPSEADMRRKELAAERLKVLTEQSERLYEQVESQQRHVAQKLEEHRALEKQLEALSQERDEERASQQEARSALRALESQLKSREEAMAAAAERRQQLERQTVRFRCEARGLRARLSSTTAETVTVAEVPADQEKPPLLDEVVEQGSDDHCSIEDARYLSLRLQHEVVALWAELRHCDEEAKLVAQQRFELERPECTVEYA